MPRYKKAESEQNKQEARRRLLAAALDEFAAQGYASANINRISQAAGFAQGTIYGIPVSGMAADGWLVSHRTGPDWLSGGMFGAEASVVAIALCSLCTLALLVVAMKRHSFVPPCWRRHG